MYFFINNTNNKPCLLAVHQTPVGLLLAVSIGNPLDFHWFGCGFAVSPLEVHQKSLLDFVVQPKMPGQAPKNHCKNTVVKKQKNMDSAYPQSNGVCLEKQWECKDLQVSNTEHNNPEKCKCLLLLNLPRLPSIALTSPLHKKNST